MTQSLLHDRRESHEALESLAAGHDAYLANRRFGALDGLRAIAVVAVIWHHTQPQGIWPSMYYLGSHGVTLFFAISGFLITTLLLRERDRNGHIDLRAFYSRRVLRIFPLYFGVLLVYSLLVALIERHSAEGQAFFQHLPYFLTFTSNLFVPLEDRTIFYFAWSVAAEEQFYLFWPPLMALLTFRSACRLTIAALVGLIAIDVSGLASLNGVPIAIVGGTLLALALHDRKAYHWLSTAFLSPAFLPALIAVTAIALGPQRLSQALPHLVAVAWVGRSVIDEGRPLVKGLSWAPLAYLGSISYGLYMLHMLSKNIVVKLSRILGFEGPDVLVFPLTLALAVLVATLSFHYYESYFLRRKARFTR